MKRRVLNFLTFLSLLLCIAVCAVWVRSYWRFDLLRRDAVAPGLPRSVSRRADLWSCRGRFGVYIIEEHADLAALGGRPWSWPPDGVAWQRFSWAADLEPPLYWDRVQPKSGPFRWFHDTRPDIRETTVWREVAAPHWALALASASPLLLWGLAHRRRVATGLCPRCGYDLRATPNRCPECGTGTD